MAHPELQLVSHIIRNNALTDALNWGLREDDFVTDEGRAMYQRMVEMRRDPRNAGGQFGAKLAKHEWSEFELCDDLSMTIEAYCTKVRQNRYAIEIQAAARELVSSGLDPMEAAAKCLERLQRNILAVGYGARSDVDIVEALRRGLQDHDLQASGVDLSACKWGWGPFNEATGGIRADDYIVFYGRPKSKKSWVLAKLAIDVYMQDKSILVYTKEMTADNLLQRIGACAACIPYHEFRTGRLTVEERACMEQTLNAMDGIRSSQNIICLNAKDANGADTVDWLQAKVEKYKPHMVFIDGMYLMTDSRGAKNQKDNVRVQNISRAIRQMILDTKTPVAATVQATRTAAAHKNANLDEIAFSDALAQDATCAIRVISNQEPDEMTGETNTVTLAVGGAREFQFSGCLIGGTPATDFEFKRLLNDKELNKLKERDNRADDRDAGVSSKKSPASAAEVSKKMKAEEKSNLKARMDLLPKGLRP